MEFDDVRLILGATSTDFFAVNPENGVVAWSFPFYKKSPSYKEEEEDEENEGEVKEGIININSPVFRHNEIFLTAGYNQPSVMLQLSANGKSYTEKWVNATLDNHHHGVVLVDGYIYGSNWINNGKGNWVCLDWESGKVMYEQEWQNKGNIIFADGLLYLYEEKSGYVGLVEPDPEKFSLISSFRITKGNGPHWAHPTIYDGWLIIRHGDILMAFDISSTAP